MLFDRNLALKSMLLQIIITMAVKKMCKPYGALIASHKVRSMACGLYLKSVKKKKQNDAFSACLKYWT